MPNGLLSSFLGPLQAPLSVLLVIFHGVIAAQFKPLDGPTAKTISKFCVKMVVPALLTLNLVLELMPECGLNYVVVLSNRATDRTVTQWLTFPLYAILCYGLSLGRGLTLTKDLDIQNRFNPAIAFNNTTSDPLLIIRSLETAESFIRLIATGEQGSEAIERAKSCSLIFAAIGDCLTFEVEPRLIDNEHAPKSIEDSVQQADEHRIEENTKRDACWTPNTHFRRKNHHLFQIVFELLKTRA